MAKKPTEKNELLKKEMLARVTPEQAEKFEARKRIKAELLEAIYAGDAEKVKSFIGNKWGIDITKIWYKKGTYPKVTADMEAIEIAEKKGRADIVEILKKAKSV